MPKLTKRTVEAAEVHTKDYLIWDEELPCFGLRVYPSGKRSYLIQYRSRGRSRRYTIGLHGVWTADEARQEARVQIGRVARGDDPAEEREFDRNAMTVRQLCEYYVRDLDAGLILGKGGRPKRRSTVDIDIGRIQRHIIPLLGTRRVKDLTKAELIKVTSRYVHTLDATLILAADSIAGYIDSLLKGAKFRSTSFAFDRSARKAALDDFLTRSQSQQPLAISK